jgi:hypothetical protein
MARAAQQRQVANRERAMSAALEQRIATALVTDTTSADLTALIAETEAAITVADATASAERTKSLDPVLSPDAKAAMVMPRPKYLSSTRSRTCAISISKDYGRTGRAYFNGRRPLI